MSNSLFKKKLRSLCSSFVLQKSEIRQPVDGAQGVLIHLSTITFDHFDILCLWDLLTPRGLQKTLDHKYIRKIKGGKVSNSLFKEKIVIVVLVICTAKIGNQAAARCAHPTFNDHFRLRFV